MVVPECLTCSTIWKKQLSMFILWLRPNWYTVRKFCSSLIVGMLPITNSRGLKAVCCYSRGALSCQTTRNIFASTSHHPNTATFQCGYLGKETTFITNVVKRTIGNRLLHREQKTSDKYMLSGIYKLTCPVCSKAYVGQTGRISKEGLTNINTH